MAKKFTYTAYRDKRIGGWHYRGHYLKKPEGSKYWNIYSKDENLRINFCHAVAHADSFKEAKATVDYLKDGE